MTHLETPAPAVAQAAPDRDETDTSRMQAPRLDEAVPARCRLLGCRAGVERRRLRGPGPGLAVTVSLLVFVVGVIVWIGFVYVARWTTWVDRRLAAWQRHDRVPARYRRPPSPGSSRT